MKLYEIPDFLSKKVKLKHWKEGYIYFDNGHWRHSDGTTFNCQATLFQADWEVFFDEYGE